MDRVEYFGVRFDLAIIDFFATSCLLLAVTCSGHQ